MYYGEQNNPYKNHDLTHYINHNLPMEEFGNGNFSQAHKILDIYRKYIKECIIKATYQETDGEGDVSVYLQKETTRLENEQKEWIEQNRQATSKIENAKKRKQKIKDEGKGDKIWDMFFDFFEENDFDIDLIKGAFERAKINKPEEYKKTKGIFEKFISYIEPQIENLRDIEKDFFIHKEEKDNTTRILKVLNLEEEIKNIKNKNTKHQIEKDIIKSINKTFRKSDHTNVIIDNRSFEEMFTSIMTTNLIVSSQTDKQLKKQLIRNHTDKVGLLNHLYQIYQEGGVFWLDIHTGRSNHKRDSLYELREDRITGIIDTAKKMLNDLNGLSFFWTRGVTPEESKKEEELGYQNRKAYVIEDLTSHLKKALEQPDKKGRWDRSKDAKLSKLFEGIHSVMEDHQFENFCEKLRDLDERKYRELLGAEGEALMKQTIACMDEEERKIAKEESSVCYMLKKITKEIHEEEKREQSKQTLLYDLAPIYPLKEYYKNIIKHIESLIGTLSYPQKGLFERIIKIMLEKQGLKKNIDTEKPTLPLSDEEFLEILKNMKNGKGISAELKKLNKKIIPDINEWIKSMEGKDLYDDDDDE